MKNKNELMSAVTPLQPIAIWDAKTGEALALNILADDIHALCSFVQTETKRVFEEQTDKVVEDATGLKGNASSYGRQLGYKSNYRQLPREVLAKSRINELFLYKIMSEVASYSKNQRPNKQYPSFPRTINLGAVDKQMASLSWDGSVLTLLWKCWSREYLIEFHIPSYIRDRNIIKFSLPLIRYTSRGYEFCFTVKESVPVLPGSQLKAGVDLGRVEAYTLAVVNAKGNRIAHYITGGRLKELNAKRENILAHKRNIYAKIVQYEKLSLDTRVLTAEKERLGNKARILGNVIAQNMGAEITRKLAKHSLSILNVEKLTWVQGNSYGSKWNHSRQQDAITHALARTGISVKKISPKNSSQLCHTCGDKLATSGRSVRCAPCKTTIDRDYNAALNIASERHLTKRYPSLDSNRLAGDNCSPNRQVIDHSGHGSLTKKESQNYKDST